MLLEEPPRSVAMEEDEIQKKMEERDDDLDRELMPPYQYPQILEGEKFSPPLIKLEDNNKHQTIEIIDAGELIVKDYSYQSPALKNL